MRLTPNSLVQISCHKDNRVIYAPPVRLRASGAERIQINGQQFALTVRRIRGIKTPIVIDDKGEFAFLNPDETIYFRRDGYTYSFLLAEDFASSDNSPFSSRILVGLLFHFAAALALFLLPFRDSLSPRAALDQEKIDVRRVKQVLDRVARREAEKRQIVEDTAQSPIAVPPVPRIPSLQSEGSPKGPENNSFLPPGFEGIRRRDLTQKTPVISGRAPNQNNSAVRLPNERYDKASGLGNKGEGPGGGGRGAGGNGWGAAISGSGSISLALIERALAENRARLLSCYDNLLLNEDDAAGRLLFSWGLSLRGEVSEIKILRTTFRGREFHLCLAEVLQSIRFPAPTGGPVIIRYPFEFKQGAAAP